MVMQAKILNNGKLNDGIQLGIFPEIQTCLHIWKAMNIITHIDKLKKKNFMSFQYVYVYIYTYLHILDPQCPVVGS